jgi:hypothetical protein
VEYETLDADEVRKVIKGEKIRSIEGDSQDRKEETGIQQPTTQVEPLVS